MQHIIQHLSNIYILMFAFLAVSLS